MLNDDSLFEDPLEDYPIYTPDSTTRNAFHLVEELLDLGDYQAAKSVHLEILSLDEPIPNSLIYDKGAQQALRNPDLSYDVRFEDFTMWLSLVPEFDPSNPYTFPDIRRLLFRTAITHMDLIMHFALICAEKGYGEVMTTYFMPIICQYTEPSIALKFVSQYEAKHQVYLQRIGASTRVQAGAFAYVRGFAVRSLASSGNLQHALDLLPPTMTLSNHTYRHLSTWMKRSGPQYELRRAEIDAHLRQVDATVTTVPGGRMANILASTEEGPPEAPVYNVVALLRYLKHHLSYPHQPPHALDIMNFMVLYSESGRTTALDQLRNKAFRSGYAHASKFVLAELLFDYHRGMHIEVIQRFTDSCYVAGVPRDEVMIVLSTAKTPKETTGFHPKSRFFGKLFPTGAICSIVWHSLVALSVTHARLERLYAKLLQFAKGDATDHLPDIFPEYSKVSHLIPPPRLMNPVVAASFTPFMWRLMVHAGPDRGAEILRDVVSVGLQPTVYHFTELAAYYAGAGQAARAFFILDRMEASSSPPPEPQPIPDIGDQYDEHGHMKIPTPVPHVYDLDASEPVYDVENTDAAQTDANALKPVGIPAPDFVMYASLMRHFIIAGDAKSVASVNERFLKRYKYVSGDNTFMDKIYADWQRLHTEVRRIYLNFHIIIFSSNNCCSKTPGSVRNMVEKAAELDG